VFLPDAALIADSKRALCAELGAEGVFPTDPVSCPLADEAASEFLAIYLRNEAHIRGCEALLANLTPFRGPSADVGTVYELGFMRALGRPVAGYSNVGARFTERTLLFLGDAARQRDDGSWEDAEGLQVEHFGLHDNLMVDGGVCAARGILVSRDVPPADRWRDLANFEVALRALLRR
jgi:nucleoside 2-deoxyribosyltransferase